MEAQFDKVYYGIPKIKGLRIQLKGRIRGSKRSRKIVKFTGKLALANRLSRISYNSSAIITKYGSLGIKVISSLYRRLPIERRIIKSN